MARRRIADSQPPKRTRRLRVFAQVGNGGEYPGVRDVYLESAELPHWECDLFQLRIPCTRVVDLIRWAEAGGMEVVYEPPGNMADYFLHGRRDDVQSLFT